jgi:transposase-like protein
MDGTPSTLLDAIAFFADPERAFQYAVLMRWPNGIACPRQGCGSASVQVIATRKKWRCKECKRQFSVRVGTIFEDSPLSFSKWLPAFWLLANTKNGTSSCELGRALGVTQKTAWFMLHRIRETMRTCTFSALFSGEVEADETFIGGKERNKHGNIGRQLNNTRKGPKGDKTVVFGMVQRGEKGKTRVRAMIVPDTRGRTLLPRILDNVEGGSILYTDASRSYDDARGWYRHEVINHAVAYVQGRVHTNHIENFWSCLKRTLGGTYIAARPFHLDAYLDEQVFRFNEREDNDGGRFIKVLKGADGKRLTYAALTTLHPRWRLRPGRVERAVARRRKADESPLSGVSDRL